MKWGTLSGSSSSATGIELHVRKIMFLYSNSKNNTQENKIVDDDEKTPKSRAWCPKFATGLNVHFRIISCRFLSFFIFNKTEVKTVILKCWTGLKPNFKSYSTNAKYTRKNTKIAENVKNITLMSSFFTKSKKHGNRNIYILFHNFWTN